MVTSFTFKSKTSDRWSESLTAEGILDMALRGNQVQWWELYNAVKEDVDLRNLLVRQLNNADPELVGGRRLWQAILERAANENSGR